MRQTPTTVIPSMYDTLKPVVRRLRPADKQTELTAWTNDKLHRVNNGNWEKPNKMALKIPLANGLVPEFTSGLSTQAERKAAFWYLHKMPRSPILTAIMPRLRNLMDKKRLTKGEKLQLVKNCCFDLFNDNQQEEQGKQEKKSRKKKKRKKQASHY